MDKQSTLTQEQTSVSDDPLNSRLAAYNLLLQQSQKLGKLATRTYGATKQFLKKDVSALHPDTLLFGGGQGREQNMIETMPGIYATPPATTLDRTETLSGILKKSHQVLAAVKTVVLPNNLFPDSVIVDRTKVTIIKRSFFWSSSVISIRIEDVLNITCSTGPLFGSLTLSSRVMNSTDHYEINYFWRKDATYLKQIIQGYMIAQHNHIQVAQLGKDELIQTLLELGGSSDF